MTLQQILGAIALTLLGLIWAIEVREYDDDKNDKEDDL